VAIYGNRPVLFHVFVSRHGLVLKSERFVRSERQLSEAPEPFCQLLALEDEVFSGVGDLEILQLDAFHLFLVNSILNVS
jgi:hypothetical protein